MAIVKRVKQEIFGEQAGSRQITAFGTAKNDNPTYTTDVGEIQNTNFLQGWLSALLPDKAPWEEDMNALFYAITSQLAYLFQQGVPEYDSHTEYPLNAIVKGVGTNALYCSLVDNNRGNSLTDPNYWSIYLAGAGSANYAIGDPYLTLNNKLASNEIWLDGQAVSRTQYSKLFEIYGTTYGAGNGTTTFNLPDFRNRVVWGADSFGYLGPALPNFSVSVSGISKYGYNLGVSGGGKLISSTWSGARGGGGGEFSTNELLIDSSLSNPIYQNGATVRPPAVKVRWKTRYI